MAMHKAQSEEPRNEPSGQEANREFRRDIRRREILAPTNLSAIPPFRPNLLEGDVAMRYKRLRDLKGLAHFLPGVEIKMVDELVVIAARLSLFLVLLLKIL